MLIIKRSNNPFDYLHGLHRRSKELEKQESREGDRLEHRRKHMSWTN